MLVSKRTVEILKNFSTINESLKIEPGNVLKTISNADNVLVRAEVAETFTTDFCIGDLKLLVSILASFKKPDLRFTAKQLVIHEKDETVKTTQMGIEPCDPGAIKYPKADWVDMPSIDVSVSIDKNDIDALIKVAKKFRYEQISLIGSEGTVRAVAGGRRSTKMHTVTTGWERELGQTKHEFRFVFEADAWSLIPDDYAIELCAEGIAHFHSRGLHYWLVVEDESYFKQG